MDWSWLTPPLATAISAALVACGALIGVLVKGLVDNRVAIRQIEVQREIAVKQMETQRDIAAAGRAESRKLALLDEKRQQYDVLIECMRHAALAYEDLSDHLALSLPKDELEPRWRAYDKAFGELLGAVLKMRLLAPAHLFELAKRAVGTLPDTIGAGEVGSESEKTREDRVLLVRKVEDACWADLYDSQRDDTTAKPHA